MTGEKWTIYWNEHSSDTYLYGSEIWYHRKNDVEFKNQLMPPGTVIKQWYSKTNYQAQRIEPALPMIDGECEYKMTVDIDCQKDEAWMVRLIFYDKYDVEAGSVVIRNNEMVFQCPLKTYSYRMQLINGGMTCFHFHTIVIEETESEPEEIEETKHKWWWRNTKKRRHTGRKEKTGKGISSSEKGKSGKRTKSGKNQKTDRKEESNKINEAKTKNKETE